MTSTVMQLQTLSGTHPSGRSSDALGTDPSSLVQQPVRWLTPVDVHLDLNGPTDRSFDRLGDGFAGVSAIDHLIAVTARFANKVAISDANHSFTYSQLLSRVLTLAQAIEALIPEGEAVGWLLRASAWQPIAMLACMAAGRILVPLNPRDPVQRLMGIAKVARISVLIGQDAGDSAEWIKQHGLLWLDVASASEPASPTPTLGQVSVDAPAVVLYTSGSTGAPKGVVNSQRNLLQRVQQYVDACHISAADVFMPLSGPTTIAGCREMLSALLTGAKLHIVDIEVLGLRGVLRQITAQQVTITYVVPALARALINASRQGDLDSLRVIRVGGEKVLWTDIALIRRAVKASCFIQVSYLSTETTGTQWFLPKDRQEDGVSVPVGYLLPGISYAVVDESGNSVRCGEVGELVIKSGYVMLGYWDGGQLSPALHAPDDPKSRIYPTGDLVVVDTHGLVRIVGRKGRQLKINGQRVEPAELESALRKLAYVKDAVAVVTDANELVLFASPAAPLRPHFQTEVRELIRQTLPAALHPTRLHEVLEIPRLPGGKIDHARLKLLDLESNKTSPMPMPAVQRMAEANKAVHQVWSNILGAPEAAGRWDEAGGDSLKLLRCVMDLEELIGRELNMEAFTVDMSAEDMIRAVATGHRQERQRLDHQILPCLVILPGSMGYGPSMAAFGAQLSKVARVIPIRYPDLSWSLAGGDSVQEMAALAVEQIKAAQPRGDVRMIGYSLGGGVAFEVASRLIEQGRAVKFLGILDTNVGPRRANHREAFSRTLQRIRSHRVTIYRMLCRSVAKLATRMGQEVRFCRLIDSITWSRLANTRFMLRLELEELLRMRAFGRWVSDSKPRLPIKGTVFACHRPGVTPRLGWDFLFEELDVIPIAGGHLDLVVEPHLSVNRPVIERAIKASSS
ncbi:non-ribosomal peptide synthetase [Bradyrhizobium cajani]|uniref:AMP-binding protein n=1 Tax=Bradyrhizobium cajani TaxID=1928661 RepID=A0A844SYB2_9BRAD|nr:AMP-binding protein [Bradyrhizobium cajani]MCP3369524.1 AMP-binding protein [Bradyrhizobium cajani]MVT71933.1 AMP-binding protein [Bradyrhizobium cajani]